MSKTLFIRVEDELHEQVLGKLWNENGCLPSGVISQLGRELFQAWLDEDNVSCETKEDEL